MNVGNIMTADIEYIRAADTVKQAAEKMDQYDIGVMPVSDNDEIVGIITDRDIVVRVIATGGDPLAIKVRRVMTNRILSCSESTDIHDAAVIMNDHTVRRLLVHNDNGIMVGIISLGDIARAMDYDTVGQLVVDISAPELLNTMRMKL